MPIGYLDVPTGADLETKRKLVKAMYQALHEAYPFPDDTRIFLREWPLDSVSQNGLLGSEPARPVFVVHIPQGGHIDAKRVMLKKIHAAVAEAYQLSDGGQAPESPGDLEAQHGEFAIFLHEHSLDTVVINGGILADDPNRVEDQAKAYG